MEKNHANKKSEIRPHVTGTSPIERTTNTEPDQSVTIKHPYCMTLVRSGQLPLVVPARCFVPKAANRTSRECRAMHSRHPLQIRQREHT